MDMEINTNLDLGSGTDITTSSSTLPTLLALAASLITTSVLSFRALFKGFASIPYIPYSTPGVSASHALSVCARAVSVLVCPGIMPKPVTKSTYQRRTVIPVITLTVMIEDLPRIVIIPPAEEEKDAAGAAVKRWVADIAEDGNVPMHNENAIPSAPAEPVFDADGGVEPSDNDADIHGQNTGTSASGEPAFDLFIRLRAIAQSRAAPRPP